MIYELVCEFKGESDCVRFLRKGSVIRSFLCDVSFNQKRVEGILAAMGSRENDVADLKFGFFERISLRWFWRMTAQSYLGRLQMSGGVISFLELYLVKDKNGQEFVAGRFKNESPYHEEFCVFSQLSVKNTFERLLREGGGK